MGAGAVRTALMAGHSQQRALDDALPLMMGDIVGQSPAVRAAAGSNLAQQAERVERSVDLQGRKRASKHHGVEAILGMTSKYGAKINDGERDNGGNLVYTLKDMSVAIHWKHADGKLFREDIVCDTEGVTWEPVDKFTAGAGPLRQYEDVFDDFLETYLKSDMGKAKTWPWTRLGKDGKDNDKEAQPHPKPQPQPQTLTYTQMEGVCGAAEIPRHADGLPQERAPLKRSQRATDENDTG
jgi:hypothetical protein